MKERACLLMRHDRRGPGARVIGRGGRRAVCGGECLYLSHPTHLLGSCRVLGMPEKAVPRGPNTWHTSQATLVSTAWPCDALTISRRQRPRCCRGNEERVSGLLGARQNMEARSGLYTHQSTSRGLEGWMSILGRVFNVQHAR